MVILVVIIATQIVLEQRFTILVKRKFRGEVIQNLLLLLHPHHFLQLPVQNVKHIYDLHHV